VTRSSTMTRTNRTYRICRICGKRLYFRYATALGVLLSATKKFGVTLSIYEQHGGYHITKKPNYL